MKKIVVKKPTKIHTHTQSTLNEHTNYTFYTYLSPMIVVCDQMAEIVCVCVQHIIVYK